MPLYAEVTFTTEGIVAIAGLLSALAGAVVYVFKLLMKAKEDQIALALEKSRTKSYQEMLDESMAILEHRLQKSGVPVPRQIAAVVPEHNSPTTPEQEATAKLQTDRARLTELTLIAGLPAREAGPRADGTPRPITPTALVTEQLRQDVAGVKEDVADVKKDTSAISDKIKENEQSPPGGQS